MAVLDVLLQESLGVGDRLVVVSQSTAALDLVQVGAGWGVGGGVGGCYRGSADSSFSV